MATDDRANEAVIWREMIDACEFVKRYWPLVLMRVGVRFVPSIEADPTAEAAASGSAGSRPAPATPSSTPSSCAPQGDNA